MNQLKFLLMISAVACSIILLTSIPIQADAYSITIASLGATSDTGFTSDTYTNCEYDTSTRVYCPTTTGIKVWNPQTQSVVATLNATQNFESVQCAIILCYAWDVKQVAGAFQQANLTSFTKTTLTIVNITQFTCSGCSYGMHIDVAYGEGAENVFLPIEGGNCGAGADLKGVCIWDGIAWTYSRFISDGSTNDSDQVWAITWLGDLASVSNPTGNRIIVKHQDSVGNHRFYLINLADSDTTFSTTEICDTGSMGSVLTRSTQPVIVGDYYYDVQSNDMRSIKVRGSGLTCGVFTKSNLATESAGTVIWQSANDGFFFMLSTTDSTTEHITLDIFNITASNWAGTTSYTKLQSLNLTEGANKWVYGGWSHNSEGEIQIWRDSKILSITGLIESTGEATGAGSSFCFDINDSPLVTQLVCPEDRDGDGYPDVGGMSFGRAGRNVTSISNDFFCNIGLLPDSDDDGVCDNYDVKTNGVGYLITLLLFAFMIALFAYAKLKTRLMIPEWLWIIGAFAVMGVSIGFGWMDNTLFIIGCVVVAGMTGFKIYNMIEGRSSGDD